jgi:hypothetical protein
MSTKATTKNRLKKEEVIGSETIIEKIKRKTPWIPGKLLRKPKVRPPKFRFPRISLPTPTKYLNVVIVYIVLFILQTGVVYFIIRDPPALGADPQSGDPIFLYPDISESFIIEGIVASILIFFSSTGFVLLYQASKYVYNKSLAIRILAIGIIMIVIMFILLQYMIGVKTGVID